MNVVLDPQTAEQQTARLFDNAVCFVLRLNRFGDTRKVSSSQVEVDADRDMITVQKKLFKCPEYKAIQQKHAEIRQYIYSRSVPAFFLRDGTYLLKADSVLAVTRKLDSLAQEAADLVEEFIAVYPSIVRTVETELRAVYNPADYPDASEVRRRFGVSYQFVAFGVPESLRNVSPELFAGEAAKLQETFTQAADSITSLLYSEFSGLLDHAIERLSGNGDGKPKIFRDSLVNNIREFLETFDGRNITNATQLQAQVDKMRALLAGVSPEYLRNSETLRTRIVAGFSEVKTAVDAGMLDRPSRAITFED